MPKPVKRTATEILAEASARVASGETKALMVIESQGPKVRVCISEPFNAYEVLGRFEIAKGMLHDMLLTGVITVDCEPDTEPEVKG